MFYLIFMVFIYAHLINVTDIVINYYIIYGI